MAASLAKIRMFELVPTKNQKVDGPRCALLIGQLAMDSSYPTGGEALDFSEYFTAVDQVMIAPEDGFVFEYDYTNKKVLARWVDTTVNGAPMTEVTNNTDLSSVTRASLWAIGTVLPN